MSTPAAGQKPAATGNFAGKLEAGFYQTTRILSHPFTGLSTAVTNEITGSLVDNVKKFTTDEFNDVKKFVMDGHWSWQVLGFIAGVGMVISGAYNLLYDVLGLDIFGSVTDAYILLYGALAVCLEYKEGLLPDNLRKELETEFLFMYRPYGRAFMYLLFGLLIFSQSDSIIYMVVGAYTIFVGFTVWWFSMQAEKDYAKMRASKKLDETHLRTMFNKADKGGYWKRDGKLDSSEFASLYQDLMQLPGPPNLNELEMALLEVDSEHNGKIDFEELKTWYNRKMNV